MIDSKELMQNNWVQNFLGDYMQVKIIGLPQKEDYVFAESEKGYGQNEFFGIELTEDILIACGFENVVLKGMYIHPDYNWQIFIRNGIWVFRASGSSMVEVKYLHHFQNLWYNVTGKHLTVKL